MERRSLLGSWALVLPVCSERLVRRRRAERRPAREAPRLRLAVTRPERSVANHSSARLLVLHSTLAYRRAARPRPARPGLELRPFQQSLPALGRSSLRPWALRRLAAYQSFSRRRALQL